MDTYIIKACAHNALISFEERKEDGLQFEKAAEEELQVVGATCACTKQEQQLYELEI